MACCLPFKSSSAKLKGIRVVNLNGHVQHLDNPVTVSQLIHQLPMHFVSTTSKLISHSKPLSPETQLEPGQIYIILPYSIFKTEVSQVDLMSLTRKLYSIAKRSRFDAKITRSSSVSIEMGSPNRFSDSVKSVEQQKDPREEPSAMEKHSPKSRSWKPVLTTINEKSFNRRSESDLSFKQDSPVPK